MKSTMLVRSVALLLLGAVAASRPQLAMADVPPLDFPVACLPTVYSQLFSGASEASGIARLPSPSSNTLAGEWVYLWRTGCGADAALMMRLGFTDPLVDARVRMPRLTIRQDGREVDAVGVRLATGLLTETPQIVPVGATNGGPGVYALSTGHAVDSHRPLTLLVRHPDSGEVALTLNLGPYAATPAPLPLNGRLVGNFYDPSKSGEGVLVEIGDVGKAEPWERQRHYLQFNWFTYDNDGRPFWISGGAEFLEGDTHVHMPAIYRGGGRFAGRKAATEVTTWGTVDMEFADCNTLRIDYASQPTFSSNINVPSGTGHLEWKRLTSVSGNRCD